jgi:hypothetical protein
MTPDYESHWVAMREWLSSTLADAVQAAASHFRTDPVLNSAFAAQVEALSSALDFMDERERAW